MEALLAAVIAISPAFAGPLAGDDLSRLEEARSAPAWPHARLSKDGGSYRLLGIAKIDAPLSDALAIVRDVAGYPDWAWEGINTRRGGEGEYLVHLERLEIEPGENLIRVRYHLNRFFKGERRFSMRYAAALDGKEAVPTLAMTLARPTPFVRELSGEIRFYPVEGEDAFFVHFMGRTKIHWAVYWLIPTAFVRTDAEERVLTVLENAAKRVKTRKR